MDIIKDPEYREANLSFKAAMTELKKKGLGSVRHYPNIDKSDLVKLYNSTYLSTSTASGLYRKVQFDIRYYFCRRGGENMVDMTKETFSVQTDPDSGLRYVVKAKDELTKNHRENDNESFSGYMPESQGNPRCPVSSYEKYISKLNSDLERPWQRPKLLVNESDDVWYCNQPVGAKKLSSFMKDLSTECQLSKPYTNHSCRSSGTSILTKCGFADSQVMSVTGHKSVQSLTQYQHVGSAEKLCMGNALANALKPRQVTIAPPPTQMVITPSRHHQETLDFQFNASDIDEIFSSFATCTENVPPMNPTRPTQQFVNCNVNFYAAK